MTVLVRSDTLVTGTPWTSTILVLNIHAIDINNFPEHVYWKHAKNDQS